MPNKTSLILPDGSPVVFDENTLGALLIAVLFRNGEQVTLTLEDIQEARGYGVELVRGDSWNDDTVTVRIINPNEKM